MTRLFSNIPIDPGTGTYLLGEEESRYIRDVLRMRTGESITICDSARIDYEGTITNPTARQIEILLGPGVPNRNEAPYEAILFQGLPKADKMSSVIQKAVELGAVGICPVACSRSVVKIGFRDTSEKTQRWQKVALEAARQSGRGMIPRVFEPMSFRKSVDEACRTSELVLIPWEEERSISIFEVLESLADKPGGAPARTFEKQETAPGAIVGDQVFDHKASPRISIFIGPEGGFDGKEVEYAISKGAHAVSLGKRILRTETAGLAVLSMLLYRLELP